MRPRLVALILLPTAAAVALTGLQLTSSLASAGEYRRMSEIASLVEQLGTLSHEMAEERDLTAWYIADRRRPARLTKVKQQREVVDQVSAQVQKSIEGLDRGEAARVVIETSQVNRWLKGLPGLRRPMEQGVLPRAALSIYSRMIADFITLHDDLGRSGGDERLIGDALALGALSRAKEQVARQRGILLVGLQERKFDFDDPAEFLGAYKSQLSELSAFQATASPNDIKRFREAVSGQRIDRADATRALVMSRMREFLPLPPMGIRGINNWYITSSATVDGMRTVERGLSAAVVARSQEMESNEQRSAIISGAAIVVLLILILLITAWVAGTLVRPLRRLRSEALEVADTRLPETVRVLRESGDLAPNVEVPSIGVLSRDEIGEVARAFDEVHREAIRLAGDEARLRNNVNAMFVNLSRRTQSLVERQIDLIDDLEQGEQDDNRLASLFKLDHLATRMRRNSENLLVLAGQEQSRRWSEPVPLSDVVRASLSEVENYERVSLRVESGTSIIGSAVNDIVHLIAELVENAIFFSPQDTKITVSSNGNETGAIILAVTDVGIGMSDEELAEANRRLAEPPAVDLSVSRRMGLFVVGRLAMRHGIRVQLRRPEVGGLSAVVLLPVQVVAQSGMPELAMAGQSMSSLSSFGSISNSDPFAAGPNPDPFGTAPARGPADRTPAAPAAAAPPSPAPAADIWSAPVMSASAVEDLWSSPFTSVSPPPPAAPPTRAPQPPASASQPSFPPSWPEMPPVDPWTPPQQEAADSTQNLPAVEVSATESEDFLPIFAAVGSDWFRSSSSTELEPEPEVGSEAERPVPRPRPLEQPAQEAAQPLPVRQPRQSMQSGERQPWSTPSDQGWAAAEVAKKPVEGGTTGAGLPKRVPKANLVPGSASAAPATPPPPMPPISAERVRSRLSSFQQGVRQGRAEMSERSNAVEGEKQ
ncbi:MULTISPECIES: sensor histidine kinase [Streptosporangium]|uniref:histidine kinase n=1 Tax=Streptosporangium brasiliense TaxID=47480 RepID=A0ABT9QVA5_9ACTN|nr:nitrate- and nitrite sensing domain-containing protein [Streptosporangium brasiliense]MDP9860907.1 signal transduction histidine kinase [Streptosporangium brasiliense]